MTVELLEALVVPALVEIVEEVEIVHMEMEAPVGVEEVAHVEVAQVAHEEVTQVVPVEVDQVVHVEAEIIALAKGTEQNTTPNIHQESDE